MFRDMAISLLRYFSRSITDGWCCALDSSDLLLSCSSQHYQIHNTIHHTKVILRFVFIFQPLNQPLINSTTTLNQSIDCDDSTWTVHASADGGVEVEFGLEKNSDVLWHGLY